MVMAAVVHPLLTTMATPLLSSCLRSTAICGSGQLLTYLQQESIGEHFIGWSLGHSLFFFFLLFLSPFRNL